MSKKVKKPWSRKKKVIIGVIVAVIALGLLGTDWDEVQRQAEQAAQLEEEQKAKEEKQKEKKEKKEEAKLAPVSSELKGYISSAVRHFDTMKELHQNYSLANASSTYDDLNTSMHAFGTTEKLARELDSQKGKTKLINFCDDASWLCYLIVKDIEDDPANMPDYNKRIKALEKTRNQLEKLGE